MIKSILEAHGLNVGLIGSIAVYINGEKIDWGISSQNNPLMLSSFE